MRTDILENKETIIKMISENQPKSEICRFLKCKQETLNSYLSSWNIEYKGNSSRKGFSHFEQRKKSEYYLNDVNFITSHKLKLKLLEEGIKEHKCENCQQSEWLGVKIPLELHHIDGNKFNNNIQNIQIICPNCHSLTPNNSGKAKKKVKYTVA